MMDFIYEFKRREPVFQHPEFGRTKQDLENITDVHFYEIDVSGQRYSREQAITIAAKRYEDPAYFGIYSWPEDGWEAKDFQWYTIEHNTFITTYILKIGTQITCRTSIWRVYAGQWKILFHQATAVEA